MGLIINHGATLAFGMKNVFLYALILSFITIFLSFRIPQKTSSIGKTDITK